VSEQNHEREACGECPLAELEACRKLPAATLGDISAGLVSREAAPGDALFWQGDPARWLFYLREGRVRASVVAADGRRQISAFIFSGELFGFPHQGTYEFTAQALTDCVYCTFDRRQLMSMCAVSPAFAFRVAELEAQELDRMHARVFTLGRRRASERVAGFLADLLPRAVGRSVDLPSTRAEVADYLGLTPETVSREFAKLEDAGVIRSGVARRIHILDAAALQARR